MNNQPSIRRASSFTPSSSASSSSFRIIAKSSLAFCSVLALAAACSNEPPNNAADSGNNAGAANSADAGNAGNAGTSSLSPNASTPLQTGEAAYRILSIIPDGANFEVSIDKEAAQYLTHTLAWKKSSSGQHDLILKKFGKIIQSLSIDLADKTFSDILLIPSRTADEYIIQVLPLSANNTVTVVNATAEDNIQLDIDYLDGTVEVPELEYGRSAILSIEDELFHQLDLGKEQSAPRLGLQITGQELLVITGKFGKSLLRGGLVFHHFQALGETPEFEGSVESPYSLISAYLVDPPVDDNAIKGTLDSFAVHLRVPSLSGVELPFEYTSDVPRHLSFYLPKGSEPIEWSTSRNEAGFDPKISAPPSLGRRYLLALNIERNITPSYGKFHTIPEDEFTDPKQSYFIGMHYEKELTDFKDIGLYVRESSGLTALSTPIHRTEMGPILRGWEFSNDPTLEYQLISDGSIIRRPFSCNIDIIDTIPVRAAVMLSEIMLSDTSVSPIVSCIDLDSWPTTVLRKELDKPQ